jgi:deoxyribodipyrimidine photo-lyase
VTNEDLRRLTDRQTLASELRRLFPHLSSKDVALSPVRGGRAAAKATLALIEPRVYERNRNFLSGNVTRLSAYLRHGVLTLAEVRDEALRRVDLPEQAGKFINELAWRDYWQRLYMQLGDGVWQDREAYKTGNQARDYVTELPADVIEGTTTLACMDGFSKELAESGYLHNHARMWVAAYVVHWRKVRWQAGARWVASTFASKAYFFNRENLERYTTGTYCRTCPHARSYTCPFDRDYEALEQTLFPRLRDRMDQTVSPALPRPFTPLATDTMSPPASGKPLLWVHTDSLNPDSAMVRDHIGRPSVFIWDTEWLAKSHISLKRIVFLVECLQEMATGLELRQGDVATELVSAARAHGADYIVAQRTPDSRLRLAASKVERHLPVVWYDPPPFVESRRELDLKRFSRYWQRAQASAMQRTRV